MDREQLLSEIMKTDFALTELRLFLNTHPCEKAAVNQFNTTAAELNNLKKEFETKYGPLSGTSQSSASRFNWIDEPWPWQNMGGKK